MKRRRQSLFARTALTLALVALVLQLFSSVVFAYYLQFPVARRAADDLAALVVLSAQTWVELPPETRADFERELEVSHGLRLGAPEHEGSDGAVYHPYVGFLREALAKRTGQDLRVHSLVEEGVRWFWVDVPLPAQDLHVGFTHDRIGANLPSALIWVLVGGTLLIVMGAVLLARHITRPLAQLAHATTDIGRGREPVPLPESGPAELAELVAQFNRMAHQVRDLLTNRTVVLAGISHDLRTPLARLRLALEMLPGTDTELRAGMRRDLDEMDHLVEQCLELSHDLEGGQREVADIAALVDGIVADVQRESVQLNWRPTPPCVRTLNATAFDRLVRNLIDNALRHGEPPVDVALSCDAEAAVVIEVRDHGPGIPAEQLEAVFRPFYRLESSRGTQSGGSGLGLAIVRQLAQANGWEVILTAVPGGGTRARLVIA